MVSAKTLRKKARTKTFKDTVTGGGSPSAGFKKGDSVLALWEGEWHEAKVQKVTYEVKFEDGTSGEAEDIKAAATDAAPEKPVAKTEKPVAKTDTPAAEPASNADAPAAAASKSKKKKKKKAAAEDSAKEGSADATPEAEAETAEKADTGAAPEATSPKKKAKAEPEDEPPKKKAKAESQTETSEAPASSGRAPRSGPNDLKVFVGGIPWKVDEETLRADFAVCGEIDQLVCLKNEQGQNTGIAFVTYKTLQGVEEALKYDGEDYGGRTLKVARATQRNKEDGKGGKGKSKGKSKGKGK